MDYGSTTYVNAVLFTIYALLAAAVLLAAWSVARGMRMQGKEGGRDHGVPARRVALAVAAVVAVTMAVTWLLGSTATLTINGRPFTDAFWLRTSDMLIATPAVLVAVLGIAEAARLLRKK